MVCTEHQSFYSNEVCIFVAVCRLVEKFPELPHTTQQRRYVHKMAMSDEKVLKKEQIFFLENRMHIYCHVLTGKSANGGGDPFKVGTVHFDV